MFEVDMFVEDFIGFGMGVRCMYIVIVILMQFYVGMDICVFVGIYLCHLDGVCVCGYCVSYMVEWCVGSCGKFLLVDFEMWNGIVGESIWWMYTRPLMYVAKTILVAILLHCKNYVSDKQTKYKPNTKHCGSLWNSHRCVNH